MKRLLYLILFLSLFSCTRKISSPSETEFSVKSFTGTKITTQNGEYLYRQKLSWQGESSSYTLKIVTSKNDPSDSDILMIQIDYPIDENQFEYIHEIYSQNGELPYIITHIEILNNIDDNSLTASFMNNRILGTVATTTSGNVEGCATGTALTFDVHELITDIFVEGMYAHHFMYRLNIISAADSTLISEGNWFSTYDLPDIRKIALDTETTPALNANEANELTQFQTYIVTKDGYEDIDNPFSLNFTVQTGFTPSSLIYCGFDEDGFRDGTFNNIWALGENNYLKHPYYWPIASDQNIKYSYVDDEVHYAAPFWIDNAGNEVIRNSADLKIYLHWGWLGEYYNANPHDRKTNVVKYDETHQIYFADILYTEIKLDDAAPDWDFPDAFIQDGWLRIPVLSELSTRYELQNLPAGEHTLSVRVVDSQMAVDPTPASYTFTVVDPVPSSEKEGILIIDDSMHNDFYTPEETIDDIYLALVSDFSGTIDVYDRQEKSAVISNLGLQYHHLGNSYFSPTDIDQFKLIIYQSDGATMSGNISHEFNPLNLYLESGGNLMISQSSNWEIEIPLADSEPGYNLFANEYLGYGINSTTINRIEYEGSYGEMTTPMAFFKSANGMGNYPNIDIQMPSFNNFVNLFNRAGGLWNVVYFDNLAEGLDPIYNFSGVVPDPETEFIEWDDMDDDDSFPSENQMDFLNGKTVGYKKVTNQSSCYILGFPLSYMITDEAKQFINTVISELD